MALDDKIKALEEKYHRPKEDFQEHLRIVRLLLQHHTRDVSVGEVTYQVTKTGMGPVTTPVGRFYLSDFIINDPWKEYKTITKSQLHAETYLPLFDTAREVYLRIDSGCEPGQGFYDQACDCKHQLEHAMTELGNAHQGLIIHIPSQDGRGKGSAFHLATLYLQEELGINTVESFTLLDENPDCPTLDVRTYEGAIAILKFLGLEKCRLSFGTNNPLKINPLIENGFTLERKPVIVGSNGYTARHLAAKREVLGHLLE